jgi:SAM-dependent methyltransferase
MIHTRMSIYEDSFRHMYVSVNGSAALGSGPGSSPEYTTAWRETLSGSLSEISPRTVLDLGCGDWQHSRLVDWRGARYVGVDVVPELVGRLNDEFGAEGRSFHLWDPERETASQVVWRLCPDGVDLAICKDVVQHLPNDISVQMVEALRDVAGVTLLVNDMGASPNADIPAAHARHVDPRLPPFSIEDAELVTTINGEKGVFRIPGRRATGRSR